MKKIIGWLLSWTLYYMGGAVHTVMCTKLIGGSARLCASAERIYVWLMALSLVAHRLGGAGAWKGHPIEWEDVE